MAWIAHWSGVLWKFVPPAAVLAIDLVAQAAPMVDPGMSAMVRDLGVVAVLVWYLWYSVKVSQPGAQAKFAEEQEKSRAAFRAEMAAQMTKYDELLGRYEQLVMLVIRSNASAVKDLREVGGIVTNKAEAAVKSAQKLIDSQGEVT